MATGVSSENRADKFGNRLKIGSIRSWILKITTALCAFQISDAFPASESSVVRREFNVTREYNAGDLFSNINFRCLPTYCSGLGTTAEPDLHCSCRCPINKPIFLQNIQNCTDTIDVCHKVLEFRSENETLRRAPTLFLPLQYQILNPGAELNWEDAGIKLNRIGKAPCEAKIGGILTEKGWIILHKKLFELHVVNAGTFFKWLGNEDDSRYLQGKLVQIPLVCTTKRSRTEDMCAAFRVMGNDVMVKPLTLKSADPDRHTAKQPPRENPSAKNDTGLIVGIVCGGLLALTLVGVAIFWVVCWKHQKERLVRKIQMQFLYHPRYAQQNGNLYHGGGPSFAQETMVVPATAMEMHHMNASHHGNEIYQLAQINGHSNGWLIPGSLGAGDAVHVYESGQQGGAQSIDQLPPPPPYPSNLKKKLYFSPEFFDPELMQDPPPLAEEFLYEVRRMIDLAKTRLRARRYMPRIPVIPEESNSVSGESCKARMHHDNDAHSEQSSTEMMDGAIREECEDDILDMEDIVGIVSLSSALEQPEEDEEEDSERKSPDGSGGGSSGKTSGDGPSNSDVSKESTEKDSGIEDSPKGQQRKTLKSTEHSGPGVTQEKVSHWLSKMPEESLEIEESPPPPRKPVRHSKLFKYFAARQSQAQANSNAQGYSNEGCAEEDDPAPSGDWNSNNDGEFRLTVNDDNAADKTGKNNQMGSTEQAAPPLLKRYDVNGAEIPRAKFRPTFGNELWLRRSPEFVSRQQILSNHNTSLPTNYSPLSPPVYGNGVGVSVASLPRQFMRQQLQPNGGTLLFSKDNPFPDSFPRINATKFRPEIQPETYSESINLHNYKPPAAILPVSSQ